VEATQTSSINLDNSTSLKYWLDDPFWTSTSSLYPSSTRSEHEAFENETDGVLFEALAGVGTVKTDAYLSLVLAADVSRLDIRDATSAMMLLFVRH